MSRWLLVPYRYTIRTIGMAHAFLKVCLDDCWYLYRYTIITIGMQRVPYRSLRFPNGLNMAHVLIWMWKAAEKHIWNNYCACTCCKWVLKFFWKISFDERSEQVYWSYESTIFLQCTDMERHRFFSSSSDYNNKNNKQKRISVII